MAYKQLFPPAIIALQEEILHHPKLTTLLANHPSNEFETRFAEIATYCNILLDDTYTPEDIMSIADVMVQKLRSMRVAIVLPPT